MHKSWSRVVNHDPNGAAINAGMGGAVNNEVIITGYAPPRYDLNAPDLYLGCILCLIASYGFRNLCSACWSTNWIGKEEV